LPLDSEAPSVDTRQNMRPVIKIAIVLAIVVAVVAILVHPYVDGLNSIARKRHSHRVVLITLLLFAAHEPVPNYNSLAASASPVVQNVGRDLLARTCIRLR
jgi:hypothetical protein